MAMTSPKPGCFRIKFDVAGDHVHCQMFYAPGKYLTYAKCGTFVVRTGRDLLQAFSGAEFIGDNILDAIKLDP